MHKTFTPFELGVVTTIAERRPTIRRGILSDLIEEHVDLEQESDSPKQSHRLHESGSSLPSPEEESQLLVPPSAHSVSDCDTEDDDLNNFVLVKEDRSSARKNDEKLTTDQDKTLGHSENDELTSKNINSWNITYSIQLGLRHAVRGRSEKPERDILMRDFKTIESQYFSFQGSEQIPDAHRYSDFRFESFAPVAFHYFRNLFCIHPQEFLLSLCNQPLRELGNSGASGSIFYVSADDEFIIKTVQYQEGNFLQKLLPGYNMNLNQNPRTLLPKFFGFYSYICNAKHMRMVVMNNLLPSSIKLHEKYDLKGSTFNRKASPEERSKSVPTFKDLDFMEVHPGGILLEAEIYNALINSIQRDCRVLESFKIMDYSLLVAIHNLDSAAKEDAEHGQNNSIDGENSAGTKTSFRTAKTSQSSIILRKGSIVSRRKLVAHSTTLESIQMRNEPSGNKGDYSRLDGIPARNAKGERLIVFLGIIDILQNYRLAKKIEHVLKATIHDGDSISVHHPAFYSQRFQNFMANQVFRKISSC
ncbi:phosphatidylinositol 4-phosphate 5-kinase type-1 alpha-like [Daphnia pulex]|uniref:phosphatidylinositol 4-phosphate 5-kinase type-1 alpha-like n=1 Tax=Daphnia pulex TaxID=6669 RepID=UPI001EDCE038|nr:phosphatidylinositol 4-phosphate 5-kinase type-1 alpha-like [Daphnia pulex]